VVQTIGTRRNTRRSTAGEAEEIAAEPVGPFRLAPPAAQLPAGDLDP
jgi:hypothetical protein